MILAHIHVTHAIKIFTATLCYSAAMSAFEHLIDELRSLVDVGTTLDQCAIDALCHRDTREEYEHSASEVAVRACELFFALCSHRRECGKEVDLRLWMDFNQMLEYIRVHEQKAFYVDLITGCPDFLYLLSESEALFSTVAPFMNGEQLEHFFDYLVSEEPDTVKTFFTILCEVNIILARDALRCSTELSRHLGLSDEDASLREQPERNLLLHLPGLSRHAPTHT